MQFIKKSFELSISNNVVHTFYSLVNFLKIVINVSIIDCESHLSNVSILKTIHRA